MKIDRVKSCLGDRVHSVSIAQSYASRRDVIEKIVSYIADQGLDVDDAYLDFVRTVDRAKAEIEVRYVPVYRATALARLFWRESKENQEASEHQEFVRFSTLFYADDLNKGNRINQLDILKIIDKKAGKINEARYENADDYRYENVPLLKSGEANLTDIVLDVPLQGDEVYPLETSYILDGNEIEARVGNTLHSTKSYQRLAAQSEKWSSIERLDVEAVLVPIARIRIGKYDQYVNCANGKIDVRYEKNRQITGNLKSAKRIAYPCIVAFLLLAVGAFIAKWNFPVRFANMPKHLFANIADILWLVLVLAGILFSLIAAPTRKAIIHRASQNKDRLRICRIFSHLLLDVSIALLTMILLCI